MEDEFDGDDSSEQFEGTYAGCKALPLSKLTPNESAIENGDVNYFSVTVGVRKKKGAPLRTIC